jgi:hypothetical protein
MTDIRNPLMLQQVMQKVMTGAIEQVSKALLTQLQQYIMENVYMYDYYPNIKYHDKIKSSGRGGAVPTFQFLKSFQWRAIEIELTKITKELFYNYPSMLYDPATYLHGSYAGDVREKLADLLNIRGWDTGIFGGKERNMFWDNYIDQVFNDTELKTMFITAFSKQGISVI